MSERQLRSNVVKILAHLDAKPVENPAWPGFPDVNYIEGLIELKQVDSWPKRRGSPLKIGHFTQGQRIFIERRWRKGGNIYLLLQVGRCYLLYNGADVQQIGRTLNKDEMYDKAIMFWDTLSDMKRYLSVCLQRDQ